MVDLLDIETVQTRSTDEMFEARAGVEEEEIISDTEVPTADIRKSTREVVRLYPGPQTIAASSRAQILIYGGEAGGGKSHYLLVEPLRCIHIPDFSSTIFRRTYPQIMKAGGIWDKSRALYPKFGGVARESDLTWTFPSGARVQFTQMQHIADRFNYQGLELPLPEFDELTQFDELQFWYIVSRNRATCAMEPYIRATCNPEPFSWVHRLIEWWIDPKTGFAIRERSGVVRWLVRNDEGTIIWGDSREELMARFPGEEPISLTFVHATLEDNPALNTTGYRASLKALPLYERKLLLEGNWLVRRAAGMRFKRKWFPIVDEVPQRVRRRVRYWDRASTEMSASSPDPDSTSGVRISIDENDIYYVEHRETMMETPGSRDTVIKTIAQQDSSIGTELWLEQDPAQAGVSERMYLAQHLEMYGPRFMTPTGSKWTRSGPFSAAAENGRVRLVRGRWNDAYLNQLENFVDERALPAGEKPPHDDDVDASSGAFNVIATGGTGPGVY
jgi:predicted phage terminase large subunit-like protein